MKEKALAIQGFLLTLFSSKYPNIHLVILLIMYNDNYNYTYQNDISPAQSKGTSFDLSSVWKRMLKNWWVFGLVAACTTTLGILFLRVTPNSFQASTTLLIKTESSASNLGDNQYLPGGIQLMTVNTNELDTELGILQSYSMLKKAVDRLDFNVFYYEKKFLKTREVYNKSSFPFEVILTDNHNQILGTEFEIEVLTSETYRIKFEAEKGYTTYLPGTEEAGGSEMPLMYEKEHRFGEDVETAQFSFRLEKNDGFDMGRYDGIKHAFRCFSNAALARMYQGSLSVSLLPNTSIVYMQTEGAVPAKEIKFLDILCKTYIIDQLEKKNAFAEGTIEFIRGQLADVSEDIKATEARISRERIRTGGVDRVATSVDARTKRNNAETQLADQQKAMRYYTSLQSWLESTTALDEGIPDPVALNITSPGLLESVSNLKTLVGERAAIAAISGPNAMELQIKDRAIETERANLRATVKSILSTTEGEITALNQTIASSSSVLAQLPTDELRLMNISRNFEQNNNIYNYLMQRLAEAQISKAANRADSKVLDQAQMIGNGPVSPNKIVILITSLIVGLILPAVVIVLLEFFDTRIRGEEQITALTPVPVIGNIIASKGKEKSDPLGPGFMVSPMAESFRYLKINLDYVFNAEEGRKVVGVTSTIKGEGKTFVSSHLGVVMASTGKRVLMIGADVRRPKLFERLSLENELGLCNYLVGTATMDEIIQPIPGTPNLHIIPSGLTPPNPVAVLTSPRFQQLVDEARAQYDYIIIDTPPVGLVSDFLLMTKYMDVSLYVVRQGYSHVHFLKEATKLVGENKVNNLYFLVNDVKQADSTTGYARYGQKYGYDYATAPQKNGRMIKRRKKSKSPVA